MNEKQKQTLNESIKEINNQGYNSICFWMPSLNVGGGSRYFVDLAKFLISNTNLKVYFMDFKDGYAAQLLQDVEEVTKLEYDPNEEIFPITEPTIVVTNSTKVIQIKKMNPKSKFLFWHFETIPCAWHLLMFNGEDKEFMKQAYKHNAMIFHDWSSRDILNNQFNINFQNKDYLHVYCQAKKIFPTKLSLCNENEINVAWLGRLGLEKIYSLYNIVDNLAKYKTNKIKRLHIIGDGWYRTHVENYCKKYRGEVEFIFKGTISFDKIHEYLLLNVDILFAMGTSVVDGAAIGVPSAIVQLSTKKFNDNAYFWLHETKEYCVGITVEQKKHFDVVYRTMEDLLDSISTSEKKKNIGKKCYQYYFNNFSDFNEISCNFLQFAINTTLTYKILKKTLKYIPYYNVNQVDYGIKGKKFFIKTKFGKSIYYKLFGINVFNAKINKKGYISAWNFGKLYPFIPIIFRKKFTPPDNKTSFEKYIRLGKVVFMRKNKNKRETRHYLFNKKNILTKRENKGYDFPTSLYKG